MEPQGLRKRRSSGEQIFPPTVSDSDVSKGSNATRREDVVWGKTPDGTGQELWP
jgi:hypothetical protein